MSRQNTKKTERPSDKMCPDQHLRSKILNPIISRNKQCKLRKSRENYPTFWIRIWKSFWKIIMTLPCVKHIIHLGKRFRSNLTIKNISFNSSLLPKPQALYPPPGLSLWEFPESIPCRWQIRTACSQTFIKKNNVGIREFCDETNFPVIW